MATDEDSFSAERYPEQSERAGPRKDLRVVAGSSRSRPILFRSIIVVVSLLSTVAADRVVGMFVPWSPSPNGLIFPPHSAARYETNEFTFTASINRLGFRDREFSLRDRLDHRVLALGDSFTFGWGVDAEQSWPKILERHMRADGLSADVANLGVPGGSPYDYADIADRAVPVLKPDLIVVAVLQSDDLAQLEHEAHVKLPSLDEASKEDGWGRSHLRTALHDTYPNLTAVGKILKQREMPREVNVTWKQQAQGVLKQLNDEERRHYQRLEPRARDAFELGKLNPDLVNLALKHPDYFLETFDPEKPNVRALVQVMAGQLERIEKTAERNHAKAIVVSVPFGIYVNHTIFENWSRYGFLLDEKMLESDVPDRAIQAAATKAGLPFFMLTAAFRNNADSALFFPLDGHFNASGYQFFADHFAPVVEKTLRSLDRPD